MLLWKIASYRTFDYLKMLHIRSLIELHESEVAALALDDNTALVRFSHSFTFIGVRSAPRDHNLQVLARYDQRRRGGSVHPVQ